MKSFRGVLSEVPSDQCLALFTPFANSFVTTEVTGQRWCIESVRDVTWLAIPFTWRREPHGALTAVDVWTFERRAFFVEVSHGVE